MRWLRRGRVELGFVLGVAVVGACSGNGSEGGGSGGYRATTPSGDSAVGSGGGDISLGTGGSSTATGPIGNETVCDGIDNDGNGIIDDVDVGKDGICDCLRIATLGLAGPWGQGDVFAAWLDARSNFGATALNDQVLTPALLGQFE